MKPYRGEIRAFKTEQNQLLDSLRVIQSKRAHPVMVCVLRSRTTKSEGDWKVKKGTAVRASRHVQKLDSDFEVRPFRPSGWRLTGTLRHEHNPHLAGQWYNTPQDGCVATYLGLLALAAHLYQGLCAPWPAIPGSQDRLRVLTAILSCL